MSIFSFLGVSPALAESAAPHAAQGGFLSMLPMLIIFIAVFYFLLIRPQNKRAKDHRKLIDELSVGDEVVTAGGMVGRVVKLDDSFVVLGIAKGVEVTLQKASIASLLPKGTLESAR